MKYFASRESDCWHRSINAAVALAPPALFTECHLAWVQLQEHTDIYLKKKGTLTPEQVDGRLLGLLQKHGNKEIAILACGHLISPPALRSWVLQICSVETNSGHDISLSCLRCIGATHRVSPEAVTAAEADWARELMTQPELSYQRLDTIVNLWTIGVTPKTFLYTHVVARSREACTKFAIQLETLRQFRRWMDAYDATRWLSAISGGRSELNHEVFGSRQLLDSCFPAWRAWAAWRPKVARLRLWKDSEISKDTHMHPFLALEGPDFKSGGSATMLECLIAQCLSSHSSSINWSSIQIQLIASETHQIRAVLDLLTSTVDATCRAGFEYKALFIELCVKRMVIKKNLQILEVLHITANPFLSALMLKAFENPHEDNQTSLIRQALPALSDSRTLLLRELLAPSLIDRISNNIQKTQNQLCLQLEAGRKWKGIETRLLVFITELQKATWLLPMLDASLRALINDPPSLETLKILGSLRVDAQSATPSATTSLIRQIDAYCKAIFVPNFEVDEALKGLIETLIALWQSGPDPNRKDLAVIIAQIPTSNSGLPCQCLSQLLMLPDDFIRCLLDMLRQSNEECFAPFVDITRLLAIETRPEVVSCWRKVVYRGIEKHDKALVNYGQTQLTVETWLEWLNDLWSVYNITTERYKLSLLKLELHAWAQRLVEHLPILKHLKESQKRMPTMQYILKRPENPFDAEDLLEVLGLAGTSLGKPCQEMVDVVISQLLPQGTNAYDIKQCISLISEMTNKGAEACMRVVNLFQHGPVELAEALTAVYFRRPEWDDLDRIAVRAVSEFFRIDLLDTNEEATEESMRVIAKHFDHSLSKLLEEARRLESLRLSLNAIDPEGVSNLLENLGVEGPSIVDDILTSLPTALVDVVERVGENEVEMQFPLTNLKALPRAVMGIGDAQSLLVRLIVPSRDMPPGFCVHNSNEAKDTSVAVRNHTPWLVLDNSKAPNVRYCHNEPSRGVYQLSRALWRHLNTGFSSLEETYAVIASIITDLARSCIVCGTVFGTSLRGSTVCHDSACEKIFSTTSYEIRLAGIGQSPAVVDLLLTTIHAAAMTGNCELLTKCPVKETAAVLELVNNLPIMSDLQKLLFVYTGRNELELQTTILKRYSPTPVKLDGFLSWACNAYSGFITPATGSLRIPSFPGAHQFLVVNASPDLETAFSAHMLTTQSESMVLFHGTSLDRLHAILCQGLRVCSGTSLQRHGAAHGKGIYMAEEPNTAWDYASKASTTTVGAGAGWKGSTFNNTRVLLGCELAGQSKVTGAHGIHVVTDARRLKVRYILLMAQNAKMPIAGHVVPAMKSTFASLRSGAI